MQLMMAAGEKHGRASKTENQAGTTETLAHLVQAMHRMRELGSLQMLAG